MYPFRFLGVGLFAVGLILFAPFFFRFLLFALLLGLAFRLVSGYRRARYGYSYGCHRRNHHHQRHHHPFGPQGQDRYDEDGIVPSDY
ncbi:hypothetical protein [Flavilitoribacter nigricans]|uniref:Uncharacterized protein n=1 Tax=Flavilitoribacter nigricans (strain ATCC 23147 / DSM 23189 / NBRC 102662 / NCIMB 1420 / SS-2) TaxID=1122177 RepID=A0A2D0NGW5_FLAN2|nr:hypothetical protein [Flavilitoribacter nigricans]PHN07735.1 hypothetical protein CRP01_04890 [Flavilitoribacter nigricans DSM 23189 = NBRC 102662]